MYVYLREINEYMENLKSARLIFAEIVIEIEKEWKQRARGYSIKTASALSCFIFNQLSEIAALALIREIGQSILLPTPNVNLTISSIVSQETWTFSNHRIAPTPVRGAGVSVWGRIFRRSTRKLCVKLCVYLLLAIHI